MVPYFTSLTLLVCLTVTASAQTPAAGEEARSLPAGAGSDSVEDRNKALARAFYEDLWFSERTDRFDRYVADEYVVHDIGDNKNVTETAIQQKKIADFLHAQGEMTGSIDFQIAEGDLVATRWQWKMQPTSFLFRIMGGRNQIPIINVFRFRDGKIVEIWRKVKVPGHVDAVLDAVKAA